jgi:HD-like signal output (HDOD) protein
MLSRLRALVTSMPPPRSAVDELLQGVADLDPRVTQRLLPALTQLSAGRLRVPLLPAVALELHSLAADPEIPFDKIAQRAVTDPNIAARIVAFGSSPLYGPRPASGVKEALSRIGVDGVRHVTFDAAFSSRVLRRGPYLDIVDRAVRHARTTSALCRLLAKDTGHHQGQAALVGLLYGLGAIVLVDALSAPAPLERPSPPLPLHAVIVVVRRLHGWTAAMAAATYRVGPDVVRALDEHNRPDPRCSLASLLRLCDHLSPSEPGARALPLEQAIADAGLPLDPAQVQDRLGPLIVSVDEGRRAQQG